jgi:hypothetical protein
VVELSTNLILVKTMAQGFSKHKDSLPLYTPHVINRMNNPYHNGKISVTIYIVHCEVLSCKYSKNYASGDNKGMV